MAAAATIIDAKNARITGTVEQIVELLRRMKTEVGAATIDLKFAKITLLPEEKDEGRSDEG